MSNITINTNTSAVEAKQNSLTKETSSWNNRTVKVASGLSAAALTGGTIAATLLGGPITLIIGLAAAALMTLVTFLMSMVSKPKVTSVETQAKQEVQMTVKTTAPAAPKAAEVVAAPAKKAVRFEGARNAVASGVNFVKAHPYKTAFGVAASVAAAGSGIAAIRAFSAPAEMIGPQFLRLGAPVGPSVADSISSSLSSIGSTASSYGSSFLNGLNNARNYFSGLFNTNTFVDDLSHAAKSSANVLRQQCPA